MFISWYLGVGVTDKKHKTSGHVTHCDKEWGALNTDPEKIINRGIK